MVAQEQRQFDHAIAFYNKALKIYEDAGIYTVLLATITI
jgi:hypothetical protein